MFAGLPILLGLILAAESTLPNGIHTSELPADGDVFEVVAGYRAGVRNETSGRSGLAEIVSRFLFSSAAAREMGVAAYGVGGEIEFFSELDRTGFRLRVPGWAKPMVEGSIAAFFAETPAKDDARLARSLAEARERGSGSEKDFRAKVEDEIRIALLGSRPYHHRPTGSAADLAQVSAKDAEQFFAENYGTDQAFVLATGSASPRLSEVPRRDSRDLKSTGNPLLKAERTLRFPDQEGGGAVIFASPVATVFYRDWYAVLLLDRFLQRVVHGPPLLPTIDPYYYRLEVPVPVGQFAEQTQEALMQELERLQYVRPDEQNLEQARKSALEYLERVSVRRWFLSLGIPERREEGLEWVRTFSADDVRATARDLLLSNRVISSWSPKPPQLRIEVARLDEIAPSSLTPVSRLPELKPLQKVPFPAHMDAPFAESAPELLASGVSVAASSQHAIFVAPDSLRVFESEPGTDVRDIYSMYRADRVLVLAPQAALDRVKQQWALFQGNPRDTTSVAVIGRVTRTDLPALFVLKVLLDRKVIESGLGNEVRLEISAEGGSRLNIQGSDSAGQRVLGWIKEIAARAPTETDMVWAREAAIHRLDGVRPDLQSLVWQWDPTASVGDIRAIAAEHLQDVARLYF